MKNAPKTGRGAKRGNKPAPYTKYGKTPFKYDNKHSKGTK